MFAVFLVSGFSLNQGFDPMGVLFLVVGVISVACLDFSVFMGNLKDAHILLNVNNRFYFFTFFF